MPDLEPRYRCCSCEGEFSMTVNKRRYAEIRSGRIIWCPHCKTELQTQQRHDPQVAAVMNHAILYAEMRGEPEEP